ncbi:aminotransferase class I/II-fold pyridoxal phosphate-dependent enzyme [Acidipropionibacterium timonense]|uniref:aminotransferase class I/II-fold pyridoxal phosphate-dependent enzyme n=1 Tax=Acidipropionibacterium timonense TaxID=2161818 RepID=UPI001030210E|nr:aminotransferase class I/II-fold pyridoxal phosphate-dependent enzyme [Acidipropionibacterium timonense]
MHETPPGSWLRTARAAGLLDESGSVVPTIFTRMSALAASTGALNLGQGFPDDPGPAEVHRAATEAIEAGHNQYPPLAGVPILRQAIAEHEQRFHGRTIDPDSQVQVTMGATEAMAASLLALLEAGDEVVTIDPFYDAYAAIIGLAGARQVCVPLRLQDGANGVAGRRFALDLDELDAAFGPRTRAVIVNSPHNPTGTVLDRRTLQGIVDIAVRHRAVVLSDEVYEHLWFNTAPTSMSTLDGAEDAVMTISSAAKTFSVTGWKIGWATGSPRLIEAVRTVKQYLTFAGGAPFQYGVAAGLRLPDAFFRAQRDGLRERRDLIVAALGEAGFEVIVPDAGYFTVAAPPGGRDGLEFCLDMAREIGVVAIPVQAFTLVNPQMRGLVRFAQCKSASVTREAAERLRQLGTRTRARVDS